MTSSISSTSTLARTAFVVAASLALLLPSLSHAATFAYVNQSGNVSMVTADNWMSAIINAPNIAIHSGVMLLDSLLNNPILNDSVGGV